jgi:hypothetical protein
MGLRDVTRAIIAQVERATGCPVRKCKPTTDGVDRIPTGYCGFTEEELDFVPSTMLRPGINYDIKCRLGQDDGEGGEDE